MSLSVSDLSAVQQAGIALHHASQCLSQALRAQAQALVEQVSNDPQLFNADNVMSPLRSLAGWSHELVAMETQLKRVYADASGVSAARAPARGKRAAAPRAEKIRRKPRAVTLSPNDHKVLDYLRGVLNGSDWTPLTGAVVAAGSGLPKGSVGVSLTRVVASGAVRRGAGGTYQMVTA